MALNSGDSVKSPYRQRAGLVLSEVWWGGAPFFVGAVVLIAVIYLPVLAPMAWGLFNSINYSQNLLFPFISVGLVWVERKRLGRIPRSRVGAGLVILAAGLAMYPWSVWQGKHIMQGYSFVAAVFGIVLWFYGFAMMRAAWAPLALVALMVPFHSTIVNWVIVPFTYWDRYVTIVVSVAVIRWLGVPAWREGFNIHIPKGVLSVTITCSGINYVLCLMVIVVVVFYLSRGGWKRRAALILLVLPVGMAANIARVVANLLVAHRWGVTASYAFFHDFSGVVFSVVALVGMLGAARVLKLPVRVGGG